MSAIRPNLPAVTPPAGDAPAVRNAQAAAFFRAAMAQVQAPQVSTPSTVSPAPQTTAASTTNAAEPTRMSRPGSLLDIRV